MLRYHDEEWGVPSHDERHLFEMLVLEGAQAGLSWSTILRKREGYRRAFAGFDPEVIVSGVGIDEGVGSPVPAGTVELATAPGSGGTGRVAEAASVVTVT